MRLFANPQRSLVLGDFLHMAEFSKLLGHLWGAHLDDCNWFNDLWRIGGVSAFLGLRLEAIHASDLEGQNATLPVIVAENWPILLIRVDIQVFKHFVPVVDPAF